MVHSHDARKVKDAMRAARCSPFIVFLGTLCLLGCNAANSPSQQGDSAPPAAEAARVLTCAFWDLDNSPLGALVESRLLSRTRVHWLERNELDRVLREQELQTLLSPAAGTQRVALGQLLKADVLILLRRLSPPQQGVQLVVCETKQGLRLSVQSLQPAGKTADDAGAIAECVEQTLLRYHGEVRDICVVPQFLCQDLSFEYEHLRAAYALLVEQALLRRDDVAVVELEEAQAITKERSLADPTVAVQRPRPLLILGEYRNEGHGADRRTTIRLAFQRGDQPLAERTSVCVASEVPKFLQETTQQMLTPGDPGPVRRGRPAPEADVLAERALVLRRSGNWEGALALTEAALLLKPLAPDLHREAVLILYHLPRTQGLDRVIPAEERRTVAQRYLRGLEHLEMAAKTATAGGNFPLRFLRGYVRRDPKNSPELRDFLQDARQKEHTLLRQIIRLEARAGHDVTNFVDWLVSDLPPAERYAELYDVIAELQDLPHAARRTILYTQRGHAGFEELDCPAGNEYVDKLVALPSPEVQRAADILRRRDYRAKQDLEQEGQGKWYSSGPRPKRAEEPWKAGERRIELARVSFTLPGGRFPTRSTPGYGGFLAASDGIDVFWESYAIFLMKQQGHLVPVWRPDVRGARVQSVCFDGCYVWAVIRSGRKMPRLLVIDPVSEGTKSITPEDGLPAASGARPVEVGEDQLLIAPLAPGKVLACGWFGRTWIGTVQFAPPNDATVKIIHEARDIVADRAEADPRSTRTAFKPVYMFTLTDPAGAGARPSQCVLLDRGRTGGCLVVDPESSSVKAIPGGMQSYREPSVYENGLYAIERFALYWDLYRVAAPGFKFEKVLSDVPEGWVWLIGGQLHILGQRWWSARDLQSPIHVALASPPWPAGTSRYRPMRLLLASSHHYGLLVRYVPPDPNLQPGPTEFYQAVWNENAASAEPAAASVPAAAKEQGS